MPLSTDPPPAELITTLAFEVDELDGGKLHRDGSVSVYKRDPWGNIYEFVKYPDPVRGTGEG